MSKITHQTYDNGNTLLFYEGEQVAVLDGEGKVSITDENKKALKGVLSTYCKRNQLGEYAEAQDNGSEASLESLAERSQQATAAKAKENAGIPPEPKKDKILGCRTPEWQRWCAKYKPDVYKKTGLPMPDADPNEA
ncbi:MAG: hypothetical protein Q7Q73_07450 [Verrucomicrobiota bacterium JB024]|nr:hypothetical protein [Verrucomicrobiota bacterium JB024]